MESIKYLITFFNRYACLKVRVIPTLIVYLYRIIRPQTTDVQIGSRTMDSRSPIKPTVYKFAHLLRVGFFN